MGLQFSVRSVVISSYQYCGEEQIQSGYVCTTLSRAEPIGADRSHFALQLAAKKRLAQELQLGLGFLILVLCTAH
jgi:hypothetical protein